MTSRASQEYKINVPIYMTSRTYLSVYYWRKPDGIVIILFSIKKLFLTHRYVSLYCPCFLLCDIHALRVFAYLPLECECAIHPPSHATKRASRVGQLCVTVNWLIVVFLHKKLSMRGIFHTQYSCTFDWTIIDSIETFLNITIWLFLFSSGNEMRQTVVSKGLSISIIPS